MIFTISNLTQIQNFQKDLESTSIVPLDVESNSLDRLTALWITLQLKLGENTYIFHIPEFGVKNITYVTDLLKSSNKLIVGHNLKYDIGIIKVNTGIMLTNLHDTFTSEVIIFAGVGDFYPSLRDLVKKYCNTILDKESRELFINYKLGDILTEQMIQYAALDVQYVEKIRDEQLKLVDERKLNRTYELENKLVAVTTSMELNGVKIDSSKWAGLTQSALDDTRRLEEEIKDEIVTRLPRFENAYGACKAIGISKDADGNNLQTIKHSTPLKYITEYDFIVDWIRRNINVQSNAQIKHILQLAYNLDVTDTNEKTLLLLKNPPEIVSKILSFRERAKKQTTYGDNILDLIHKKTGRVHANFNQNGTSTGRYSSSQPNLQNIPRENDYRSCFIAEDGYDIITIDYDQQEYRLATGERKIIDAYLAGKDMHTLTASIINNVPLDKVTKEQRTNAKPVNFGLFYGATVWGLKYNLGISLEEAQRIYDAVLGGIPTFIGARNKFGDEILKRMYSKTLLGRRRYFKGQDRFEDTKEYQKFITKIKREGFNHIIQGTGADITKTALNLIYYENPFGEENLKIILTEHDEIVCEVRKEYSQPAFEFIKSKMLQAEQPFLGEIPASISGTISNCWSK